MRGLRRRGCGHRVDSSDRPPGAGRDLRRGGRGRRRPCPDTRARARGARLNPRLNRLLAADGRCLDIAVDHGFFGEESFLAGIEDLAQTLAVLVAAGPDAIQLSPGQAPLLQRLPGPKPALVLRADVANVYGGEPAGHLFNEVVADAAEQAVRLDAACICANLLEFPGAPELRHQCIRNLTALRSACDRYAMPLMVEPLVFKRGETGYTADGDAAKIVTLVRQSVELGADIVKCDPTAQPDEWPRVVEIAGRVPVLARGGGRLPEDELLRRTTELIAAGAAGIVYGRNISQHPDPAGITRRLMAIVHG
jgi:DhnA family fructose-bisphosphate aldolase class Ia